jgi:hypothetical protein
MKARPKNEVKELNIYALLAGMIIVLAGGYGAYHSQNNLLHQTPCIAVMLIGAYLIWRS